MANRDIGVSEKGRGGLSGSNSWRKEADSTSDRVQSSHDVHLPTMVQYPTRQTCTGSGSMLGTHCRYRACHCTISPVMNLYYQQKALWKANQLTLASGGCEHA